LRAAFDALPKGGKTFAVPAAIGIGAATAGGSDAQEHELMKHPKRPKHAASFDDNVERYREKTGEFAGGSPADYKRGGAVKAKLPKENPALGRSMQIARGYASGGRVHAGPVIGETGGREDALPIDVGANSYVIPADVVSALGEGNTIAGMRKLEKQFGTSVPRKASGGTIPILISDGEFVLAPEQVAKVGRGDMAQGHRALDAFVKKIRAEHIATLSKLPPPSK